MKYFVCKRWFVENVRGVTTLECAEWQSEDLVGSEVRLGVPSPSLSNRRLVSAMGNLRNRKSIGIDLILDEEAS